MTDFYFDQKRNLLIYPNTSRFTTNQIRNAIPEAREINGSYLAVPRNLRNSQVLRLFNYPVAPVIHDQNYDFPIEPGRKPLPHQKVYANFQILHPRCHNLGDPGTMKTLASLWAAERLMQWHKPGKFRALIVAPLTILDTVWASAIFKNFLSRRSFEILHGTADKRSRLLAAKPDFAIINYEGVGIGTHTRKKFELGALAQQIMEDGDIKLIIIDESRGYGDSTSLRSRVARVVFKQHPYMWMLCGSPTPQAPTDCYGMGKLLNNAQGKSFRTFQMETMTKVSQFKWVPQRDGYRKAKQLLTPAVRFGLDEIWNGPEQTIQQREVELTDEQKKLMVTLKRDLQMAVKNGQLITAAHEGAARQKLLQISMGAIYDANHRAHVVDSAPRLHELDQIVASTQRKIVVFVGLTSIVHLVYKHLSKHWRCGIINGEVSQKNRAEEIRLFASEPNYKAVIADPSVVSHGINEFVVADTGVWYGPVDKVDDWIQGNKRIRRPGQLYPSTIFQIVSNKTEKAIFQRLERNETLQGLMLDMVRKGEL
jgi:SNF2 family DNA or RNA helicase